MEILLFIFFLLVFIGMLIGGYVIKSIKNFKKAVEQAADKREQQFRSEVGRQNQQYSQRSSSAQSTRRSKQSQHTQKTQYTQSENQYTQDRPRQTQTATGETIIDHHHQARENRKIFDDEEGEYVEFTEEK